MGELVDFITGQTLPDTHDERYRQKIARLLVTRKGYPKSTIIPQHQLQVNVDGKSVCVPVAFLIKQGASTGMIIHYGPGSLVTRHRSALAMGRLVSPCGVPLVVVTNGEQADILDGRSGRLRGHGLEAIPSFEQLTALVREYPSNPMTNRRMEMEARIVMAFEVNDRCPCDTTVCHLDKQQ